MKPMESPLKETWLVVKPISFLWALEQVEEGRPALEVMQQCIDFAHGSMEESSTDE